MEGGGSLFQMICFKPPLLAENIVLNVGGEKTGKGVHVSAQEAYSTRGGGMEGGKTAAVANQQPAKWMQQQLHPNQRSLRPKGSFAFSHCCSHS